MKLEAQQPVPDFVLPDAEGQLHRLSDYAGRYVVLYIYPKDDTPGCTREACGFRDVLELKALDAVVLGLSPDSTASHQAFGQKYQLNFPLLSDPSLDTIRAYGGWGTKNMYGKVTEGIKRSTFLIGPDGQLIKAWYSVKVDGHPAAVIKALKEAHV